MVKLIQEEFDELTLPEKILLKPIKKQAEDVLKKAEEITKHRTQNLEDTIQYQFEEINKLNGRTQIQHLRHARAVLELDREELVANGAFANVGRPSKATIVQGWRRENPSGRKIDCHRETGLSRPTIDKYWEE